MQVCSSELRVEGVLVVKKRELSASPIGEIALGLLFCHKKCETLDISIEKFYLCMIFVHILYETT